MQDKYTWRIYLCIYVWIYTYIYVCVCMNRGKPGDGGSGIRGTTSDRFFAAQERPGFCDSSGFFILGVPHARSKTAERAMLASYICVYRLRLFFGGEVGG